MKKGNQYHGVIVTYTYTHTHKWMEKPNDPRGGDR